MKEAELLKRIAKKKITVTEALLVSFFITGNIVDAVNIDSNYVNKEYIKDGLSIVSDNKEIENLGIISNKYVEEGVLSSRGNGVIASNQNIKTFLNSGSIKIQESIESKLQKEKIGNGVLLYNANINNFINKGDIDIYTSRGIEGSKLNETGNGIIIKKGSANNIVNNGRINVFKELKEENSEIIGIQIGNGVSISDGNINTLENNGKIMSSTTTKDTKAIVKHNANGINSIENGRVNSIVNFGNIEGKIIEKTSVLDYSGNGIDLNNDNSSIENSGNISGIGISKESKYSGNGISLKNGVRRLKNYGVIKGSNGAVAIGKGKEITGAIDNYGVMAGRKIYSNGIENSEDDLGENTALKEKISNYGVEINLNSSSGDTLILSIKNGKSIKHVDGEVINGKLYNEKGELTEDKNNARDSYTVANELLRNDKLIINGAGVSKGALIVNENLELADSIVNGYKTATYISSGTDFIAKNVIFNGGGLKGEDSVIRVEDENNKIELLEKSIINGDIDLGEGSNRLILDNSVYLNGNIKGSNQSLVNLGKSSRTEDLKIFNQLEGIGKVVVEGKVTFYENAKLKNIKQIELEEGELLLRIDPGNIRDEKVIGHALFENNGEITSKLGKLVIGTNGMKENTIISMGGTKISSEIDKEWWRPDDKLVTNSLIHDAKLQENGDVKITLFESIPLDPPINPPVDPPLEPTDPPTNPPLDPSPTDPPVTPPLEPLDPPINQISAVAYEKLNQIYKSILSAKEVDKISNTTLLENKTKDEAMSGLLEILDQIYRNNPYGYILKASRDNIKLYRENIDKISQVLQEGELLVEGRSINSGIRDVNSGEKNFKVRDVINGGLVKLEYGLSNDSAMGTILGGARQNISFDGKSKIEGNSLYIGSFTRKSIDSLKIISGLGYQYAEYNVERGVENGYDRYLTQNNMDTHSINIFLDSKYVFDINKNLKIEPKIKANYYYIYQDSTNEGYKKPLLSLGVDQTDKHLGDLSLGVDIIKELSILNGTIKNRLSLDFVKTLGNVEKNIGSYIVGEKNNGSNFEIKGVKFEETFGKIGYGLEYEKNNGMIYSMAVDLEFGKNYNRSLSFNVGLGYIF